MPCCAQKSSKMASWFCVQNWASIIEGKGNGLGEERLESNRRGCTFRDLGRHAANSSLYHWFPWKNSRIPKAYLTLTSTPHWCFELRRRGSKQCKQAAWVMRCEWLVRTRVQQYFMSAVFKDDQRKYHRLIIVGLPRFLRKMLLSKQSIHSKQNIHLRFGMEKSIVKP
jgi:hypothetical protein